MHLVYGFCDGNARAAVQEYQRCFPDRRIPSRSVFMRIHQILRDTGSLPSVSLLSERRWYERLTHERTFFSWFKGVHVSPPVEWPRIGVSRMQVWRTLHEEVLYRYHDQRVQHLEPGDHAQRMDLCNWVRAHPDC